MSIECEHTFHFLTHKKGHLFRLGYDFVTSDCIVPFPTTI